MLFNLTNIIHIFYFPIEILNKRLTFHLCKCFLIPQVSQEKEYILFFIYSPRKRIESVITINTKIITLTLIKNHKTRYAATL